MSDLRHLRWRRLSSKSTTGSAPGSPASQRSVASEYQHLQGHQQRKDHNHLRLGLGMLVRRLLGYGMQFEVKHTHTQYREYYDTDDCREKRVTAASSAKKNGREWGASG